MKVTIEISDYDLGWIKNSGTIPEELRQKIAEEISKEDCLFCYFGDCSYNQTGCENCRVREYIDRELGAAGDLTY